MSGAVNLTVEDHESDLRLDRWFKRRFPALGHGPLERLLRTGQVRVDGRRAKAGARLTPGQVVRVPPLDRAAPAAETARPRPRPPVSDADARALRAAVLFEDDWVIALNKPPGLAVQGGSGQTRHLDAMLSSLGRDGEAPRLVHRLDRDTSGVLLLARTALAARRLSANFKDREAQKIYWALVAGAPAVARGTIDLALAKRPGPGGEKVGPDDTDGKPARTLYQVIETRRAARRGGAAVTALVLTPLTGRTHQLRAHCAAMGWPIAGDGKYGGAKAFPEGLDRRLMLHAREIALPHPDDGTTLRVTAPPPPHLEVAWQALGFDIRKAEGAQRALHDYGEGIAHSPPGTARRAKQPARQRAKPSAKPSAKPPGNPTTRKTARRPGPTARRGNRRAQ